MEPIPIHIDDEEHIVFFTGGNPEVHRILLSVGRTEEQIFCDISIAFRISCILADLVLQSSSNYYESNITKQLVKTHLPLFEKGIAVFVIREEHGDFYTDREAARVGYPETTDYRGYFGKEGDVRLKELKNLGFIHYRPGSMGQKINNFWSEGLTEEIQGETILTRIRSDQNISTPTKDKLILQLQDLPNLRGNSAFIWDIVKSTTENEGLSIPRGLNNELRLFLLRTYFRSASVLYGVANVICNPSQYLGNVVKDQAAVDKYNPQLFLSFCETLGIRNILERLSAQEIIQFREMLEFVPFRKAYFEIVDAAKSIEDAKISLLQEYRGEVQLNLFRQQSCKEFLASVRSNTDSALLMDKSNYDPLLYRLWGTITDPMKMPFVMMQEAILGKYEDRLNKLFEIQNTVNGKRNSSNPIINVNKMEVINMRDKYEAGQAGSMGPNSSAHDMSFSQIWQQSKDTIDLNSLASQLGELREKIQTEASSTDETIEVGLIAQAEKEAKNGDGPKVLKLLSKLSGWSLGFAEKIGAGLVAAAIKTAIVP